MYLKIKDIQKKCAENRCAISKSAFFKNNFTKNKKNCFLPIAHFLHTLVLIINV